MYLWMVLVVEPVLVLSLRTLEFKFFLILLKSLFSFLIRADLRDSLLHTMFLIKHFMYQILVMVIHHFFTHWTRRLLLNWRGLWIYFWSGILAKNSEEFLVTIGFRLFFFTSSTRQRFFRSSSTLLSFISLLTAGTYFIRLLLLTSFIPHSFMRSFSVLFTFLGFLSHVAK